MDVLRRIVDLTRCPTRAVVLRNAESGDVFVTAFPDRQRAEAFRLRFLDQPAGWEAMPMGVATRAA